MATFALILTTTLTMPGKTDYSQVMVLDQHLSYQDCSISRDSYRSSRQSLPSGMVIVVDATCQGE